MPLVLLHVKLKIFCYRDNYKELFFLHNNVLRHF